MPVTRITLFSRPLEWERWRKRTKTYTSSRVWPRTTVRMQTKETRDGRRRTVGRDGWTPVTGVDCFVRRMPSLVDSWSLERFEKSRRRNAYKKASLAASQRDTVHSLGVPAPHPTSHLCTHTQGFRFSCCPQRLRQDVGFEQQKERTARRLAPEIALACKPRSQQSPSGRCLTLCLRRTGKGCWLQGNLCMRTRPLNEEL